MPKDGPIGCQKMAMLRWTATGPHQLYRSTFEARPMPQLLKLLKLCQMDRMQVFSEVLFVEIEIVIAFSLTLTTMEVDSRENTRKLGIWTSNFTFSFSRANSSVETRIRLLRVLNLGACCESNSLSIGASPTLRASGLPPVLECWQNLFLKAGLILMSFGVEVLETQQLQTQRDHRA